MKVTLTHDGKSVELDLTAEQMTALGLKEEKKRTGYERVKNGTAYYKVSSEGDANRVLDSRGLISEASYIVANYYSDKELAEANARADRLMRQLRRFAAENGGIPSVEDWKDLDGDHLKYFVRYSYSNYGKTRLIVDVSSPIFRSAGVVYFNSKDAAEKAIEKFHDELIWYCTEYEAMLR